MLLTEKEECRERFGWKYKVLGLGHVWVSGNDGPFKWKHKPSSQRSRTGCQGRVLKWSGRAGCRQHGSGMESCKIWWDHLGIRCREITAGAQEHIPEGHQQVGGGGNEAHLPPMETFIVLKKDRKITKWWQSHKSLSWSDSSRSEWSTVSKVAKRSRNMRTK